MVEEIDLVLDSNSLKKNKTTFVYIQLGYEFVICATNPLVTFKQTSNSFKSSYIFKAIWNITSIKDLCTEQ